MGGPLSWTDVGIILVFMIAIGAYLYLPEIKKKAGGE